MNLTHGLVAAFVRCRYKAYLKCTGRVGSITEYERLETRLSEEYQHKATQWLKERFSPREMVCAPLPLEIVRNNHKRLLLNVFTTAEDHPFAFPPIERVPSGRQHDYALWTFSPGEKLVRHTKVLSALLAMVLAKWADVPVSCVNLVFGRRFGVTRLALFSQNGRTTRLGNDAMALSRDLEAMCASQTPPKLLLNAHCDICEFRDQCLKDATDRDDLSLLKGLQPREIDAWNQRGIFSVTQLAHTFRPKAMGRSSYRPKRHSQQLQAMAIRDRTTYVRRRPEIPASPTRVYLDVEGIPDAGLFYLIGVVVATGVEQTRHQFWADSEADEQHVWRDFVAILSQLGDYVIVHFGRYERDFIREMARRYGGDNRESDEAFRSRLFDVHAAIRTNVYFPVYSNRLKDIASFLGVRWEGPIRSGIDSIVWRYKWEETGDAAAKKAILRYNYEDCLAVIALLDHLVALVHHDNSTAVQCKEIDDAQNYRKGEFGSRGFALPAMHTITKSAYFKYQQDRVFFRTDKNVRNSSRRKRRASRAKTRINAIITCVSPRKCPRCESPRMTSFRSIRQAKIVRDLKFMRAGVKRWVVKYETNRYQCLRCGHTCYSLQYPTKQALFGHGVAVWAVYQHIALRQSLKGVTESVNDVFGYSFSEGMVKSAHALLARRHEITENLLLSRLREGNVICADEAKIRIRRNAVGYVWVFSGPEVVVYRFSRSREAAILHGVLKEFGGVLVSDFYGAYDSVTCLQQKCLVHLVRDINDDLLKAPFDEELKDLATRFTALMTPIVESIDLYGLTKRHLGKFVSNTERYREWIAGQQFTSKIAQGYQKRIGKYGDRLFTFLSHDGVPWNNNLAENAVKLIVSRRKLMDGLMSEEGLTRYLIFLSIYQTLRRKGGSFLRFLLSEKTDVFDFLGE